MELTNQERLILTMLCEIHAALKIKNGIDPGFVQEAIFSRNEWGLEWKYTGLFQGEGETPPIVREVCDILEMWERLEHGYAELTAADKARVAAEAAPFGEDPKFYGFDGNNECDYLNASSFLIDQLDRFQHFKARSNLNAHLPTIDTYRRMLAAFEPMREPLINGNLNVNQIIALIKERVHPSRR